MAERARLAPRRPRHLTPGVLILGFFSLLGLGALLYRFVAGLGAATNLDQQYPWGLWIAIDVATGVALAAGGFTVAFLAHVVHQEKYETIVRPALLTALLGYTFVGIGVLTDLGRYYDIWHVLVPSMWQGNSVLLEVGLCVVAYTTVLYIEFLPVLCERFAGRIRLPWRLGRFDALAERLLASLRRGLDRVLSLFIIAGVVLSFMHQSSLGTLMAIAPSKLHPLWLSPILPLLFLLSALAVGYPMVILESVLASRSFKLEPERRILQRLARLVPVLLAVYLAAKTIDLVNRDAYRYLAEASVPAALFIIEVVAGVVIPLFIFLSARLRQSTGWLFAGASLVVAGVALNRLNVFIIAYRPPYASGPYVPAWTEVAVTLGFVSLLVLLYRFAVLHLPVIEHLGDPRHA